MFNAKVVYDNKSVAVFENDKLVRRGNSQAMWSFANNVVNKFKWKTKTEEKQGHKDVILLGA